MKNERAIRLDWTGTGLRFSGGGTLPETPAIVIDGNDEAGPSPMLTLLLAAAGCTASDVVLILEKMRVKLHALGIGVHGVRREEDPRRYTAITFRFTLAGDGLDRSKAERAVSLSLEKYCSVVHSLRPDIVIRHEITLE